MNKTNIPWADRTWNPITGCTKGCDYCYARAISKRFGSGFTEYTAEDECRAKPGETFPYGFMPTTYEHRLEEPLRLKKPACIFLGSMGDLFDPAFPDTFRDRIFTAVAKSPQHTYLLLTKQPEEMRRYFTDRRNSGLCWREGLSGQPIPNLHLGVTVTNQADADERIPLLLDTPAAIRWVSVEPMLGAVSLAHINRPVGYTNALEGRYYGETANLGMTTFLGDGPRLDWVVVGGKTPGKALHEPHKACNVPEVVPMVYCHVDTCPNDGTPCSALDVRLLRDQCVAAAVPFFYKHGGTIPELDGVKHDAVVSR